MTKFFTCILVVLFFCPVFSLGQNSKTEVQRRSSYLDISYDETNGLRVVEKEDQRIYFGANFTYHLNDAVYFDEFDSLSQIEVTTLIPKKGKYKKVEFSGFRVADQLSSGIFYSGYKRMEYKYPEVTSGCYGQLNYTRIVQEPRLLGTYYFAAEDLNIDTLIYQVTVDAQVQIDVKKFCFDAAELEETVLELDGGKKQYKWVARGLKPLKTYRSSPRAGYYVPHIAIVIKSTPNEELLGNVDNLYSWYSKLVKETPENEERIVKELNDKVQELIADKSTDEQKIESIFNWVKENIKYVAFEAGMQGFVPRSPTFIFSKRYGDCKDMANLLKYMLVEANLDAHLAWIGTRDKPYSYEELPTPVTDNHMICYAQTSKGENLFLDATSSFVSFTSPTPFIQGKQVLVEQKEDFKLLNVPISEANQNERSDELLLELAQDNESLNGKSSTKLTGYTTMELGEIESYYAGGSDDWDLSKYLGFGGKKTAYIKVEKVSPIMKNHSQIEAEFVLKEVVQQVDNKMYVSLNFTDYELPKLKKERSVGLTNRFKRKMNYVAKMHIPEGYKVKSLPEATSLSTDEFSLKNSYRIEGEYLILENSFEIKYLLLDPGNFSDLERFRKKIKALRKETLVLEKQ